MKTKKYKASTEREALDKVKLELGADAVIMQIRRFQPKGFFGLFKKSTVEVVAAYEEKGSIDHIKSLKDNEGQATQQQKQPNLKHESMVKDFKIHEQEVKIQNLEEKLVNTEELLTQLANQATREAVQLDSIDLIKKPEQQDNEVIELFYESLIKNGVTEELAQALLGDLNEISLESNTNINNIIKIVYNRIVDIIGPAQPIELEDNGESKAIIFMGPTGVGKTTTIAKLASFFLLAKGKNVGMITADTYRIAAVEQLRTYADILGIELLVVYTPEEMAECIERAKKMYDIVFIDTAGISHKNSENMQKLKNMLEPIPDGEKLLVLSTTAKYDDLVDIVNTYAQMSDYRLIFTKLDETSSYGALLNISYITGKPIAYVTNGQDVPDDIQIVQPEIIAKALLGSTDI